MFPRSSPRRMRDFLRQTTCSMEGRARLLPSATGTAQNTLLPLTVILPPGGRIWRGLFLVSYCLLLLKSSVEKLVKTSVRETDWQPFKSLQTILQTILQTNTRTESVSLFRFTSVPPGAPPGAARAALAVLTTPDTSTVQFNAACQKMYLTGGWTKMHLDALSNESKHGKEEWSSDPVHGNAGRRRWRVVDVDP